MKLKDLLNDIEKEYGVENYYFSIYKNKIVDVHAFKNNNNYRYTAFIEKYNKEDSKSSTIVNVDITKGNKNTFTNCKSFDGIQNVSLLGAMNRLGDIFEAVHWEWISSRNKKGEEYIEAYVVSSNRLYKFKINIKELNETDKFKSIIKSIKEERIVKISDILYVMESVATDNNVGTIRTVIPILVRQLEELL